MKILILILFSLFFQINSSFATIISNLDIKIIGAKNLDKEFIESIIDLDYDSNEEEIKNYIIKELFSTGYFESVTAEINNDVLIINLIENPIINKILFIGNERFDDKELENILYDNLDDISIYNKLTIEKIRKILIQNYKAFGFNLVKIDTSYEDINNNEINLYYNINEGEITKIKKINIIGNKIFSSRKIRSIIRSTETRFYKLVSGSSKYNQNLTIIDENKIKEFYSNRGYKNIQVTSSVSELIKDTNKVILNYFIEEGNKYKIDNVNIILDSNIIDSEILIDEKLINDLDIKTNKTYNKSKINSSTKKIYKNLENQGLLFFDIQSIEHEKENTVDITFLIKKINEKYVSEINIEGNTRTKDRVIRREIELNEGDPYIPSKIKNSKDKINALNFFSKADIKTYEDDDNIRLNVDVKEKSTGDFNIGATYDSFEGVSLLSGLKERNIFGDGRFVSLSFNTSSDNAGINFEVVEPYIYNKKINLLYNINAYTNDYSKQSGYKSETQTIGLGSRYKFTNQISHYVKFDYLLEEYKSITSSASDSIKKMEGDNIKFVLSNSLTFSELDTKFRPSEGYRINWYNKYALDHFIHNKISYDVYFNFNKKVLSFRNEVGNVASLTSDDVPDSDKFSLGGRKLRGFDIKGVGPRNSSSGYIGGNNIILSQIDYSVPLSEGSNNLLDLVTFIDFGQIYENKSEPINREETLRVSVGSGFNLNTPIGPLSITYAIPIQSESYDKEKRFVFSIGWVN